MKNSIKLKYGEKLEKLLEYPDEFTTLVKIAFNTDEKTGEASKEAFTSHKKAIDNLILWGMVIQEGNSFKIRNKKIIDITLKRAVKKKALNTTLLTEVNLSKVPLNEQEYFNIALSFRELFFDNLKSINARTVNIEKATYDKWVTPIRLMIENDKITTNQLREVWRFLKGHSFWSANVQSTAKLREKFQTIHSQIKSHERKESNSKNAGNVSSEYLEGVLKDLQSD